MGKETTTLLTGGGGDVSADGGAIAVVFSVVSRSRAALGV